MHVDCNTRIITGIRLNEQISERNVTINIVIVQNLTTRLQSKSCQLSPAVQKVAYEKAYNTRMLGHQEGWNSIGHYHFLFVVCTNNASILRLFMVALCNRADHYISILFLLSFFFPRLISAVRDWMFTILRYKWCGLIANLECRSEMRCTRLAAYTGRKKSPSRHHRTICRALPSQLRRVSTIGKKLVKQQYLLIPPLHVLIIW